ncbi:hypothetical protein FAZ19_14865 [Sphingobacterium alkalisoli]|uniref:Uncharacterized protein n=1 Tax=Sphingobacterium alkalisoli TaxID=1874115 RepID=A0A4U0GZ08_9SPHI|nr:hypothetical protein [Sphingobacterium alkalisoli]TJY64477.1 hypothetical protein FAZ19_14865 [Sphingobacterium alkalisoli]
MKRNQLITVFALVLSICGITLAGMKAPHQPLPVFAGITMHAAPAPPAPYTQSVYFRYDGQHVGNKFKVESNDGCPFYAVVSGSPITYDPVLSDEYIFGVFFKSEPGCSSTRSIKVYYDNNGIWTPHQVFTVNL